jgi:hypothetical protein
MPFSPGRFAKAAPTFTEGVFEAEPVPCAGSCGGGAEPRSRRSRRRLPPWSLWVDDLVDRELLDVGRTLHLHPGGGDPWLDPVFEEGIDCPRLPEVDDSPATIDGTRSVRGLPSLDQRDCTTLRRGRGRMSTGARSRRSKFCARPHGSIHEGRRKGPRRRPQRRNAPPATGTRGIHRFRDGC